MGGKIVRGEIESKSGQWRDYKTGITAGTPRSKEAIDKQKATIAKKKAERTLRGRRRKCQEIK